jgi:16S rRNA C1402 (ribose-2'-O) methylase RsmI
LETSVVDGVKGECVLVLRGVASVELPVVADDEILAQVMARVSDGLSQRDAIGAVASGLGLPKRAVYRLVVGGKP